jgi:ubiquinol-cytochrome c reductase cytochrome b subunit
MFGSILLLFFLPWIDKSPVRSANYRPTYKWFFWVLVVDVIVLGYLGQAEPTATVVLLSQLCAAYYFAHFLIILPIVSATEKPLPLPNSISESVLHGEEAEAAPIGVHTA